ncbi:unnamed protein product [Effrenium voratum]|uniref:Dynein heavy chain n=1 Tax=Effrenium voratum TaxID=2562239 RepID=A0AA36JMC5_9DINO|nr:unnamed protein product [Effrenium voratum]
MDHWQPVTGNRPTSLPPLPRKLDRAAVVEYTRGLAPLCKPGVRRLKYFGQQQWTHRPDRHAVFTCGAEAEVKPGSERRIRSGVISRASSRPSPRQSVAEAPSVRSSQKASSKTLRAVKAAYQAESRAPSPVSEEGVEIGGQEAQERREMLQRQQLREMRTGDDAVSYFTRYGANTKVKLIHCILASGHSPTQEVSPYDLLVVPEDRIKRETGEYFTITASGVVHFMPGQLSECVSLSEWVHQCMMYRVLKSMSFFRLYLHRKAIAHWRQNARDAAFCRKRARLSRGCFFARPTLISPMLKVKALASEVGASTMVALPEQCTRLEDFEMATATSGEDGIRQELERRRESMVLALEELIATIRRSSDQLSKRKASMAATRSIAKEKLEAKERFRMEQIVHEDDAAARSCVRLADCLLQANLVASVTQTAEELLRRVEGGVGEHKRKMFAISVHLGQPGEVILEPSTERFLQVFRHLYEDLISVAEGVPCIASALSLASHAPSAAGRSLSEVLASHRPWSCCLEATEKKLTAQLREAQRLSLDTYEPYRKILNYKQAWNEASFAAQNHSLASLSQEVDLMNQFQEQLQRFRAQRHVGVLVIEGRELREELAAVRHMGNERSALL